MAKLKTMQQRPAEFVRLSEIAPSIQQVISYATPDNFTGQIVDGYEAPQAWLTYPAALALKAAQEQLESLHLSLCIFDAYRPRRAVQHFMRWANEPECPQMRQRFHPELAKAQLFPLGYLAEYSSHMRGSTVDLSLVRRDASGEWRELDMGTEFDFFGAQSATHYLYLNHQQQQNRLFLTDLMQQQGFRGFEMEWWHFTLQNELFPNQYFDFPVVA